ncbi:hypothetical protein [Nitrosovibrio tenuis]|uniref:Uncharacterized protein n=1 Tax=Nitrosovibrio tenuis TaxID=1233 RepID=A0A1H7H7Y1_9PROT|nr:hypothetical protein [Nitrosovibrio tenuis]SEK46516.1 hypothetical protein SAMN05216387_101497 [Nitrosovibrio tenuis]
MENEIELLNDSDIQEKLEDEGMVGEEEVEGIEEVEEVEEVEGIEEEEPEEEERIYRKAIKTVESHERKLNLLYSGAGMYWLGMSIGWKAFRVVHTRRSSSTIRVRGVTRHLLTFPHCSY